MTAQILVGTCNWSDHADFYPPGTKPAERIGYYAKHFPIVEVDSTFYTLQPRRNFEAWCERTPDGFLFDVKAFRELTMHNRSGNRQVETPSADTFEKFIYSLAPMRECSKLAAICFQFPPWFKFSEENLDYISTLREFLPDDTLTIEFRHNSWYGDDAFDRTTDVLREQQLSLVMVDEPQIGSGSAPPVRAVTNPRLAVIRFHGRNADTWYKKGLSSSTERFNYLYNVDELSEWVQPISEMAQEVDQLQVLFNNNYGNYAVRNARDMESLLGMEPPDLKLPELL